MRKWVNHTDQVIKLQLELKNAIENNNVEKVEKLMDKLHQIELTQVKKYLNREVN